MKAVLQRLLQGGVLADWIGIRVESWLKTELPRVRGRMVDLLGQAANGELHHIELQSRNDVGMALRMLAYGVDIYRVHGQFPQQLVLYFGREPLGMPLGLSLPALQYSYRVLDMREVDGEALLESPRVEENVLAILARLRDERAALRRILRRIQLSPEEGRARAMNELSILSGLRPIQAIIKQEIDNMPLEIDLTQTFLYEMGHEAGERRVLSRLVARRFGSVPAWAEARIKALKEPDVEEASLRLFDVSSLEELLGPPA